jgi:hypothetical protein
VPEAPAAFPVDSLAARRAPPRWGHYALLALLGLLVVSGRVLWDSRAALLAGRAAEAQGTLPEAIRHHHHAIRMYAPASPFVSEAVGRLFAIAEAAKRRDDVAIERTALEAVRAGLLGARSFYTPFADRLTAADDRLAQIYAQIEDPAVAEGASLSERERFHRALLATRPGASVGGSLLALFGFGLWVSAAVLFTRRGIDRTLRLRRPWAVWLASAFVAGVLLFFLGLRLA